MPGGCDDSRMNGSRDACNKRAAQHARRFRSPKRMLSYRRRFGERPYYKFFA